ncbi:MAG: hypothetical protein KIT79_09605 [Deltaproteobacteria bacterium]|nr:hypothetical protein [Deltaproteobacteria bacterium]
MKHLRSVIAGITGGFFGNGLLGGIYSISWVRDLLYDPARQSRLFREVTPLRNIPVSVAGLVVLSAIHGVMFGILRDSVPGSNWKTKGIAWGVMIWAMYWLFQEWFIYMTLLGEPLSLAAVELGILLIGSIVEGLIIVRIIGTEGPAKS